MKISKIFHFLYFSVLSIPLLSIPIFAIYSMNHEISGNSINTSGYEVRNKYETNEPTWDTLNEGNVYHYDTFVFEPQWLQDEEIDTLILSIVSLDSFSGVSYFYGVDNYYFDQFRGDKESKLVFSCNDSDLLISFNNNEGNTYIDLYFDSYSTLTFTNVDFIYNNIENNNYLYMYISDIVRTLPEKSDFQVLEYVYNDGIVLDDEDIVSQFIYSEYNFMDKYLPMYKFAPFNGIYTWISSTFFASNTPIVFTIFYQWFAYWLFVSLCWLIFDVLMYVPLVVHRWLDKGALE